MVEPIASRFGAYTPASEVVEGIDLSGVTAIVTGAGSGIGVETARALALAGADVVLAVRRPDAAEAVAQEINAMGKGSVRTEQIDLSSFRSIRALAARWGERSLNILINNAGGGIIRPFLEHDAASLRATVDRNLWTALWACHKALPGMVRRNYGRIINIGSVTSVAGYAGLGPYGASRGGVRQLTMSLADDWGPHGITVNCLAPGWFKTTQNKVMYEDKEWVAYLTDRIPVKRPGQPDDLDSAVVFLAAESSRYITGQTLLVDGGISTGAVRALPKKS